ncbi:MAG: hypothetical protein ACPIA7_09045 [Akkermansiaceae bacterium]
MKSLFSLTALVCLLPCNVPADANHEIQLGVEAVAGYRSGYIYRGFELAGETIDFQLETEIALNNHTALNIGSWYATETGKGEYDESALFSHLRVKQTEKLTLGLSATYRNFGNSSSLLNTNFDDGIDIGTFANWQLNEDLIATAGAYYDFGAAAWYVNAEAQWSKVISNKTYISLNTGASYVNDYYGRDGMNDAYGRLAVTHHLSDTVSITPYFGGSLPMNGSDTGDDQAYAGVWFEIRF